MKTRIESHKGGISVEIIIKHPPKKIFTIGPIMDTLALILSEGLPYQITAPGAIILKGKRAVISENAAIF
ncbi:hypothetical protein CEE45_00345 [Candidatus Heimdallarchaeota archaeon B3_Heim]|nr:MAG: hypothetical protein CEE45_00345 [Candidatus Heimdallarchaeota archaeon B3_Heim]